MAENNTVSFAPGVCVFHEGDQGNLMYILVEGAVELRKSVENGEAVLKIVQTPNEFFGEMALIDGRPRSATAITVKPTRLIPVDETVFEGMILGNPKFALTVIRTLSARIRSSNVQISELIETIPRERVTRGMSDYALRHGEKIFDGSWKIGVTTMKEWINSHLGISPDQIDEHLDRLLKGGAVRWAATSAQTKEHILLSEAFIRENDRREK